MQTLILASTSTYRRELLKKLRVDFITCSSAIDESPQAHEQPDDLALRLSISKAQAAAKTYSNHWLIGSDQVATCENNLLGKPGNPETAFQQLKAQSGKRVSFYTAVCLLDSATGKYIADIDICHVHFRTLSDQQIQRYLALEQPYDCAGSFKSEGYGITLFNKIEGDDPNALIGLPLIKLIKLLDQFDLAIP